MLRFEDRIDLYHHVLNKARSLKVARSMPAFEVRLKTSVTLAKVAKALDAVCSHSDRTDQLLSGRGGVAEVVEMFYRRRRRRRGPGFR